MSRMNGASLEDGAGLGNRFGLMNRRNRRNLLKDSPEFETIQAEYEQLWIEMQEADAEKVSRMLERSRRGAV
ncbi:hypothetical protein [Saccharibacillus kuerlensis]|uniref:Uncharacterized protein n=1 Tax=Saccharibacillus kuerlensis TaxID=459527 RepID=A0ABQ2L0M5_9BACL|nr:hypothetical protein [Saccharibacillus kuerlensis]GGN98478.1 hypothetical protein GCM10010969_17650 [Saccharibacillus kuerlensis]